MIATLNLIKDRIQSIYGKYAFIFKKVINFLFVFLALFLIGRNIGFNSYLASPLICLAIGFICAFLPVNGSVIVCSIYILIHIFSLSIELGAIATIVMIIIYLLFFRFAPKTGYLLILAPILFYIKLPYLIPVIAALTLGMPGIIAAISGTFLYGLIDFASKYSSMVTTLDEENVIQNISFIFNSIINNKEIFIIMISFALVTLMIYLIKRLSVDHSWIIAIVSGVFMDFIIEIIAFSVLSIEFSIVGFIFGHLAAIAVGLILELFIFSVDYSATEFVQFEDGDYYYYVKAIPKISVTSKNRKVKKINTADRMRFVHTEGKEDDTTEIDISDTMALGEITMVDEEENGRN